MTKVSNEEQSNNANVLLCAGVLTEIAIQYEEQWRQVKEVQADLSRRIKDLEERLINEGQRPIYKMLYKPEYGDYREYVELVAKELRRMHACRYVSGSLPCHHNYIQKDTWWKSCTHCGMIAPLGQ